VTRVRIALGATLVLAACGPGRVVRHGEIDTNVLGVVEQGVERVRGLRFTAPVPGRVLDEAGVKRMLDDDLAQEFKPGDLERLSATYARLGLLPPGTALAPVLQELYTDELGALYDPRTKTLAIAAGGLRQQPFSVRVLGFVTGRDLLGEVLIAHELTHALQDQHFGLPTTTPPITDSNGDRTIARRALIEGDATLASTAYLGGSLDKKMVQQLSEEVAGIPEELASRHPNVPDVIRTSLAFQYNQGTNFAASAYLRGGWPAVDAAHRDPPVSSEQVLHNEKYFDQRDMPVEVTLAGLDALERDGWTRIVEDTFGELDILVLVRTKLPERAATVAAGWGGDRFRALQRDGEIAIVWLTAWDTEHDAVEFADAVPDVVSDATVERQGDRVLVLIGAARGIGPAVWKHSRCARAGG
jgi:hypothetical protein